LQIQYGSSRNLNLISYLAISNQIECLYLRKGPFVDEKKIQQLKNKNIDFIQVNCIYIIKRLATNILFKSDIKKEEPKIRNILVFTIGPILISSIIFQPFFKKIIIVIEGLGRVFSSRLIYFRFIKRFIQQYYKVIFSKCKYVVTLNYSDATYLTQLNISSVDKVKVIPGTGFNIESLQKSGDFSKKTPKYIDFIARSLPEKGFYDFIFMRQYLIRHYPELAKSFPFRIITPKSDIEKLSSKVSYINSLGIIIKPYIIDPYNYYKESKAIILPTTYGEGLSRVVIEAVYFEIPLLVSRNQGTEEILPYNYKYFTISKNPSVLIAQLLRILNDQEYIHKTFKEQKKVIETFYSTKKSIEIMETYLN